MCSVFTFREGNVGKFIGMNEWGAERTVGVVSVGAVDWCWRWLVIRFEFPKVTASRPSEGRAGICQSTRINIPDARFFRSDLNNTITPYRATPFTCSSSSLWPDITELHYNNSLQISESLSTLFEPQTICSIEWVWNSIMKDQLRKNF